MAKSIGISVNIQPCDHALVIHGKRPKTYNIHNTADGFRHTKDPINMNNKDNVAVPTEKTN